MVMDRRSFIKTAGAATAAATVVPAASVAFAGEAAAQDAPAAKPVVVYDADICIIGAGNSGLAAAVEAAQQGLGVIVLEKQGAPGGGGIGTEGLFAVGSEMQKEAGIVIEPAAVISTEMKYSHNRANGLKWLDLINASGENISWLKECGVNFTGVVDDYHGGLFETFHWFGPNRAHDDYTPHMVETAKNLGVQFLTWTPGKSLIQDESGAITGVIAEKYNGDLVQVNAKAAVIATGGFANNDELLQQGGFQDTTDVVRFLYGYDGEGINMAIAAGGASNVPRISGLMQLTVSGAPGGEYGTFGQGDGLVVAGHDKKAIWVNEDAERFCAEDAGVENWMADMIPSLMHRKLYAIYDAAVFEEAFNNMIMPRISWEETLVELQDRIDENPYNDFFSADTLEELVAKAAPAVGLDAEVLMNTVNTYQEMCETGEDAYFGKPAEYMQKLDNPPYYFCYMPQACMVTFGGIRTSRKMEVVDKNGDPIPGLYSSGVESADLWPNIYTINVPGGTNANNINSGRFAAKYAAAYIGDAKLGAIAVEGDDTPSAPDLSWPAPEGTWKDGIYTDTERGMFGWIQVTVTIEDGKITAIEQTNELETTYVGVPAMNDVLISAVIEAQSPDVATVGGATMTCNGFRRAVQSCLEQAANLC